jgi:hypothetical protein
VLEWPREETKGVAVDFGYMGRKQLWAEKGRGKGNSFLFSENIFVKNNNLEIAR